MIEAENSLSKAMTFRLVCEILFHVDIEDLSKTKKKLNKYKEFKI